MFLFEGFFWMFNSHMRFEFIESFEYFFFKPDEIKTSLLRMSDVRRWIRCCRRVTVLSHTRRRQRHFNTQSPAWISDAHLSEHFIPSSFFIIFFTVFSSVCLCFMFTLLACFFFSVFQLVCGTSLWYVLISCWEIHLLSTHVVIVFCSSLRFSVPASV